MGKKITKMPNRKAQSSAKDEQVEKFNKSVEETLTALQAKSFISGMRTAANVVLNYIEKPQAPVTTEGTIAKIKEFCDQTLRVRDHDILKSLRGEGGNQDAKAKQR